MYSWIWKKLPGNRALKSTFALLLVIAGVALCFLVIFPWIDAVFVDSPLIEQ